MTALELVGCAAVALALVRIAVGIFTARAEREESRRIAWKYLTRPATVTQTHKDASRVIEPPAARRSLDDSVRDQGQ